MKYAYLGLGSNLGNKKQNLNAAIFRLSRHEGINFMAQSSFYETEPTGYKEQDWFVNCVVKVETVLEPQKLLACCLSIEKELGRVREKRWGPRTADIDVLLYEGFSSQEEALTLPHPRMLERLFVLQPLFEMAPTLEIEDKPIAEWLKGCNNTEAVKRVKSSPIVLFDELREWGSFAYGLEQVSRVLEKIGNPHLSFDHILVGGTNGKGTLSYAIAQNAHGKVGLFLSPHIRDIRERITFAGHWIPDVLWQEAYAEVLEMTPDVELSYFEWLLVLAVQIFYKEKVNFALFEVGMGGRQDATNSLDPKASILTNVSLDHMQFLGDTVEKIALEKIEIARKDKPFLLPKSIYAIDSVNKRLSAIGCAPIVFEARPGFEGNEVVLDIALETLGIAKKKDTARTLPGRREFLNLGKGVFLDGAHNEAAWKDLVKWIEDAGQAPINILCSLSQGRDPELFLSIVQPIAKNVYVWEVGFERALATSAWPEGVIAIIAENELQDLMSEPLLVCGSLYLMDGFLLSHMGVIKSAG